MMKETLYFHREKEENWEIEDKAEELGWSNSRDIKYLGYELEVEVEITNINNEIVTKALKINGVDVSDKNIFI